MKKIVFYISLILLTFNANAQVKTSKKLTVQFYLNDSGGNEIRNFEITLESKLSNFKFQSNENQLILNQNGIYYLNVFAAGYKRYQRTIELQGDTSLYIVLVDNYLVQNAIVVRAISGSKKSGFVNTVMTQAQLNKENLGQDLTYLLGNTASAVTTSDAGAGVGYTGIRIRGSDATRINVTVNGVPINDAESHGVYWVNMPDLASSSGNIQIQRGVGSSTVGTGAFGANININNNIQPSTSHLFLSQSYGSFNTIKSTLMFGTGNINGLNFSGRLSKIHSNGYLDRANSDLESFQLNLKYEVKSWLFSAVSFGGKEKTYQSWYGTPESRIKNDVQGMNDYADRNYLSEEERSNLLNSGRTYNYYTYENQTDNYNQTHYQFHINKSISNKLQLKSSFFTTTGKGYYEEYKKDASFSNYHVQDFVVNNDTITSTNLVRQRWLDNVFYGNFTSANYKTEKTEVNAGICNMVYDGKHFGKVVWAEIAQPFGLNQKYYESKAQKRESNAFIKVNRQIKEQWFVDVDLQVRNINYNSNGIDNDGTKIDFDVNYLFFNPKLGVVRKIKKNGTAYANVAIGNREPVRTDFIDNSTGKLPKHEELTDLELGYIYQNKQFYAQANFYNMSYKNQLVLTGELNDVGNTLRRNVDQSFRRGLELIVNVPLNKKLMLNSNLTLSSNKIKNFNDLFFDYDSNAYISTNYKSTDISFSPNFIAFVGITDKHIKNVEMTLNIKRVSKQYLDNTGNESQKLDAYQTFNFNILKQFHFKNGTQINFKGMINNLFGIFYSNNGYTYKYRYSGTLTTENFYYPQSGRNFMFGIDFKFL
jgi:iron complex outermembrane recepter protein